MRLLQIFVLTYIAALVQVSGEMYPYYDLNCSIELSSEWKCSYDLGSRDAMAKQMFFKGERGYETSMFLLASEGVNPGGVVGHDEVYTGLLDEMLARFQAERTIRSGNRSVAGVDGAFRIMTTRDEAGKAGFAGSWYGEKNGFLYSLTLVDQHESTTSSSMIQECEELWDTFRVIDSSRLSFMGNQPRAEPWSAKGVLHTDLKEVGWLEMEQVDSEFIREWAFGSIANVQVGVIPLGDIALNEDVLREALMSYLNINRQLSTASRPVAAALGSVEGLLVEIEVADNQMPLVLYLKYAQFDGYLVFSVMTCLADEVLKQSPDLRRLTDTAIQTMPADTAAIEYGVAVELAEFYNQVGLQLITRSSPSVGYPLIAHAYQCSPENSVYLTNVLDVALLVQREAAAKELVKDCDEALMLDPNILARLAVIESRIGQREEGMRLFSQAIDLRLRDTEYIQIFLNMLAEEGRDDDALLVLAKLRESGRERDLMLLEIGFYLRKKELDSAEAVLVELEDLFYRDANSLQLWAEILLSTERYDECIELCEAYLETDRNSVVMAALASAFIEKKEIHVAKKWIEEAIELNPSDQSLKTYHDYVSGLLGRQGNLVLNTEVEPVPILDTLLEPVSAPRHDDEMAAGAHFDLQSKAVELTAERIYRTTYRYRLTIHDKAGLREWNEIGISFEPLYEKLYINELRVYDSQGGLVFEGAGDMDSLYVVEDTSSGMLTNGKDLRIPLVGLEVGFSAELTVSLETLSPQEQLPFKEHFFASSIPVRVSTLSVSSHDESLVAETFNFDERSAALSDGAWRIEYPPEFRQEAHLPSYPDYVPFVVTGPSGDTWEAQGDRYLEEVGQLFAPDEWALAVAESIKTKFPGNPKAQMAAAMSHVQDRLRYQGVLFGVRYQIPNESEDILRHGYGDCKDHSLLLVQLLRALDIESHPFLLNTNRVFSERIPTSDQFNHMLVYASLEGTEYFLDATQKSQDPLLPNLTLAGSSGLVVEEGGSRIVHIPESGEAIDVRINRIHMLEDDGVTVSVRESVAFSSAAADQYRDAIYHISRRDLDQWLEGVLSDRHVDADLLESNMSELLDVSSDMTMSIRYDVNDYSVVANDQVRGYLGWERMYLNFQGDSRRHLPFEIRLPVQLTTHSRFRAEDSISLDKHTVKDSADTKWCSWNVSVEDLGDSVKTTATIMLNPGIYPASDYAAFRKAIGQYLAHLESPIRVLRD